jgi:hypothetical protein
VSKEADIEKVLSSVQAARVLIGQYLVPGPRSAVDTVDWLIDILDDREFVAALDRLNRRRLIRLVELKKAAPPGIRHITGRND